MLLDSDRLEVDRIAGRDAWVAASRWGLDVVLAKPNLEGLLIRLYEGRERHTVVTNEAKRQLRKLWPEYDKGSVTSQQLKQRFGSIDLRRAALHDNELRRLLGMLGL